MVSQEWADFTFVMSLPIPLTERKVLYLSLYVGLPYSEINQVLEIRSSRQMYFKARRAVTDFVERELMY